MRTFAAPGISLTVKKHRGTQRLAVFCTEERGKVEAVARGIGNYMHYYRLPRGILLIDALAPGAGCPRSQGH